VKLYTVHILDTDEELGVAALSTDQCADVFVTFWVSRTGSAPGEFYIEDEMPVSYPDDAIIENVEKGEVAGVLVLQSDGSLLFEPAIC